MPGDHSTDTSPPRQHRRALTDALMLARQRCAAIQAKTARWLVLAGIVFLSLWATVGYTIAIWCTAGPLFALFALIASGKLPLLRARQANTAAADANRVEMELIQDALDTAVPGMRIVGRSPITAAMIRDARVIPYRIDAIDHGRCLTGLHHGQTPFCATYLNATQVIEIRRPQMPVNRAYERVFSGIVAMIDHPGTRGWLTLSPRDPFSARSIVNAVLLDDDAHEIHVSHPDLERQFSMRGSSAADAAQMLTPALVADILSWCVVHSDLRATFSLQADCITVSIPMPVNPFTLKDNPAMWETELQRCVDTAQALSALFDALRPEPSMAMREAC